MSFRRGTVYLTAAWSVVVLTGYVFNVWLARTFTADQYGVYGVVMAVLVWIEIVIINGLPYAVQKFVASDSENAGAILHAAGRIQAVVAVILFAVSYLAAPLIAAFFRDARLTWLFRLAFVDILVYGFFHLLASLMIFLMTLCLITFSI